MVGVMSNAKKKQAHEQQAYELIQDVAQTFFLMRQMGQKIGAVTPAGAGAWGLMRSLYEKGPQTVPQIAKARPVSRQHIQKLVNELVEKGWLDFQDNPKHKSSHLVALTKKGEKNFIQFDQNIREYMALLSAHINPDDLLTTRNILKIFRDRLKADLSST